MISIDTVPNNKTKILKKELSVLDNNIEVKKIIKKPNIENTKFSLFFENS